MIEPINSENILRSRLKVKANLKRNLSRKGLMHFVSSVCLRIKSVRITVYRFPASLASKSKWVGDPD